jgi:putative heme-binding domain-containing protein
VPEGRVRGPSDDAQQLYAEDVRALSAFDGDEIAYAIVDGWKNFSLPTRRAAADVLVTRSKWSRALLAGIDKQVIEPQDVSATARRSLAKNSDSTVVDHANRVLGRYRDTGEDKLRLIAEKRKAVLNGDPDIKAGHEVAKRTCFVCHKLHGEGADVGPDLTGVGRSTLDALLHNIIDPNEVIGNGFENTEVELKDGRTLNGRIVEDSPTRLKLLASGPIEHIVAKTDIAVANGKPAIRTSELSLMPEALEQIPDKDFRDMIWYLLNPPGDNRPWTPALRKELLGDENAGQLKTGARSNASRSDTPPDGESVALWNPEWKVTCPDFEGAPAKLVQFAGRNNVLMTHPYDEQKAASLQRVVDVPAAGKTTLAFDVAAHESGDWELCVYADEQLLAKQVVDQKEDRWKHVNIDLSQFAGKKVALRLENRANDWSWEFGYWHDVQLKSDGLAAKAR